jgi:hypothetical protein
MKIDFGRLTDEQTLEIAIEALSNLNLQQIATILRDVLREEQVRDLIELLQGSGDE